MYAYVDSSVHGDKIVSNPRTCADNKLDSCFHSQDIGNVQMILFIIFLLSLSCLKIVQHHGVTLMDQCTHH